MDLLIVVLFAKREMDECLFWFTVLEFQRRNMSKSGLTLFFMIM